MLRKIIMAFIFLILLVSAFFYWYLLKNKKVGIYDYDGTFNNNTNIYFQHFFTGWYGISDDLLDNIEAAQSKNRTVLITLEPWPYQEKSHSGEILLKDIQKGEYDETIRNFCIMFQNEEKKIIIRFGHEMELKTVRYPWSNQSPRDYILAYTRFVNKCKSVAPSLRYMWSPSGEEIANLYWPGGEYVDYIGLSIYSFREYDIKYIGHQRSFDELVFPRYKRFQKYLKPIILSEVGVTGDEQYKKEWLKSAHKAFNRYPFLYGLVYFHSFKQDDNWEAELPIPDWRIKEEYLADF